MQKEQLYNKEANVEPDVVTMSMTLFLRFRSVGLCILLRFLPLRDRLALCRCCRNGHGVFLHTKYVWFGIDTSAFFSLCPRTKKMVPDTHGVADGHIRALLQHCARSGGGEGTKCVKAVDLRGCTSMTDTAVRAISDVCVNLESFTIDGTEAFRVAKLTSLGFAAICRIKTLKSLIWRCTVRMDDTSLGCLAASPCAATLQHLDISGSNRLTDAGVAKLSACKSLRVLRALGCRRVTGAAVVAACGHKMRVLDIGGTVMEDRHLQALVVKSPMLIDLCITSCRRLQDESLVALGALQHLKKLNVRGCKFSDDGFRRFLAVATNNRDTLTELNIRCRSLTELSIQAAAQFCPGLLSLKFDQCKNISNQTIIALGRCTCLQTLVIGKRTRRPTRTDSSHDATDVTDITPLINLTQLRNLSLLGFRHVKQNQLLHVARAWKHLRRLDVRGCECARVAFLRLLLREDAPGASVARTVLPRLTHLLVSSPLALRKKDCEDNLTSVESQFLMAVAKLQVQRGVHVAVDAGYATTVLRGDMGRVRTVHPM